MLIIMIVKGGIASQTQNPMIGPAPKILVRLPTPLRSYFCSGHVMLTIFKQLNLWHLLLNVLSIFLRHTIVLLMEIMSYLEEFWWWWW